MNRGATYPFMTLGPVTQISPSVPIGKGVEPFTSQMWMPTLGTARKPPWVASVGPNLSDATHGDVSVSPYP